jgi:hypothetical protein
MTVDTPQPLEQRGVRLVQEGYDFLFQVNDKGPSLWIPDPMILEEGCR